MRVPRRNFADGRYGQIHFRMAGAATGEANPLVCLHMFPQSSRNFISLLPYLGQGRDVYAPDFPGYGESTPPLGPISAEDLAASIWEFVDTQELLERTGKIDLFGIHAGSKLAVELAFQRPADVARIVLSSAAVLVDTEIAALRNSLSHVELDREGTRFRKFWSMIVRNTPKNVPLEIAAGMFAEMLRGGEAYSWGSAAVLDYNEHFAERLSTLEHPIALLNPEDDLFNYTPRTVPYLRNGELLNLPGWGTGFLETKAEDLAQIIAAFIDDGELTPVQETALAS